ncbi:uncharacterized protein [Rutidosis leptorrhynchoides]|uniref:uncharacterized protein n=1 Tax=Rutidosis leptorrhynchoides TaxID=125765 RepID=UPI003A991592
MKIISYNIRGFVVGPDSKFGQTKSLICREKPSSLALQETKLHTINYQWVYSLWGSGECEFIQSEMVGKSGGQLIIWDTNCFEAEDLVKFECVIGIRGKWKSNGTPLNVINLYGPHDDLKKRKIWGSLEKLFENNDEAWVLCGDFNEVRNQSEQFNCAYIDSRARCFNKFILKSSLPDIPIGCRSFTRISDDGTKCSKID